MSAPRFLTQELVLRIHAASLENYGGTDGIREQAGFEAAVAHPEMEHHYTGCDLFGIAAAYAFHLAESQAFLDGNKRTGAGAALVFLEINGVNVDVGLPELTLHEMMIAIAEKRLDKAGLAARFRELFG